MGDLDFGGEKFDPKTQEPAGGDYQPVEAGRYTLAVVKSERKKAKSGKGEYISCEMEILDGKYKGRKVFEIFNILHTDDQTQEIGRGRLSALFRATGVMDPDVMADIYNAPFEANVGVKMQTGGEYAGTASNYIKTFIAKEGKKKGTVDKSAVVNKYGGENKKKAATSSKSKNKKYQEDEKDEDESEDEDDDNIPF